MTYRPYISHRSDAELIRIGKQKVAMTRVSQAIANGTKKRSPDCQICGKTCKTVAHHHRGYDYPFDVWFICPRCNYHLDVHDGSLNLDEAKAYVRHKYSVQFAKRLDGDKFYENSPLTLEPCFACGLEARLSLMVLLPISEEDHEYLCQRCWTKAFAEQVEA